MSTVRSEWDTPVDNADLLTDEVTQAPNTGEGLSVDQARADGLESVAPDEVTERLAAVERQAPEPVPSLTGLVDVAFASTGLAVAETVIGTDDRVRITPAKNYPWAVHAALRITARDGSGWIGTAFFVSPRVLVTAGHCVFIHATGSPRHGWVRSIDVMPGRDGVDLPFGSVRSARFASVRGWTQNRDDEYDYGVIVLDTPLGSTTGWLGFGAFSDATLTSSFGNLSGYPGDRGGGTEQWYMARRIDSVAARKVYYDIDTFGGQSGSAVYRISGGNRYAVGIHAYGVGARPLNSATRITRPVFDNLQAWKAAHA